MAPANKRIMVAVDNSEGSKRAFSYALSLAGEGDTVVALHVRDDKHELQWAHDSQLPKEALLVVQNELTTRTETLLAGYEKMAKEEEKVNFARLIVKGDPRTEICAAAERENVDVVVIGSRGRGPVKRLLLGSVSDWVVHHCNRPVLVVRDRSKEEEKERKKAHMQAQVKPKATHGCCAPAVKQTAAVN